MQFPSSEVSGLFSGIRFLRHRPALQRHVGTQILFKDIPLIWNKVPALFPPKRADFLSHRQSQVKQALGHSLNYLSPTLTTRPLTYDIGRLNLFKQDHPQTDPTHAMDETERTDGLHEFQWCYCTHTCSELAKQTICMHMPLVWTSGASGKQQICWAGAKQLNTCRQWCW